MLEAAAPVIANTPLRLPALAFATADLAAANFLHEHLVGGVGACWGPCGNISMQGGVITVTGGGVGRKALGMYAGLASKPVQDRHSVSYTAGGFESIKGISCSVGINSDGSTDWSDVEVDPFTFGFGANAGTQGTLHTYDTSNAWWNQ